MRVGAAAELEHRPATISRNPPQLAIGIDRDRMPDGFEEGKVGVAVGIRRALQRGRGPRSRQPHARSRPWPRHAGPAGRDRCSDRRAPRTPSRARRRSRDPRQSPRRSPAGSPRRRRPARPVRGGARPDATARRRRADAAPAPWPRPRARAGPRAGSRPGCAARLRRRAGPPRGSRPARRRGAARLRPAGAGGARSSHARGRNRRARGRKTGAEASGRGRRRRRPPPALRA